jgi:hypothetical protein
VLSGIEKRSRSWVGSLRRKIKGGRRATSETIEGTEIRNYASLGDKEREEENGMNETTTKSVKLCGE